MPKRSHVLEMNMAPEEGTRSRIRNLREENTHTVTVLPMGLIPSYEWKEHIVRGPRKFLSIHIILSSFLPVLLFFLK